MRQIAFMVAIILCAVSFFSIMPQAAYFFSANPTSCLAAEPDERQIAPILDSAEGLFKAMKAGNYQAIWARLTTKSRKRIVKDLVKAMKDSKPRYSDAEIETDLTQGGPIARAYWNAIVTSFNPDMVLEQSKWEMGEVKKNKAEINILYKKSQRPAVLQMFKENNQWKVGLVETFWSRKK